ASCFIAASLSGARLVRMRSAPRRPLAWSSMAFSRLAPSDPMATSAAMPRTTDNENKINRRREARESRQAILRMKFMRRPRRGRREEPPNTRKTRKERRSQGDTRPFPFGVVAKVGEKAQPVVGGAKIIVHLSTVFVGECGDCFDLEDDFIVADEVR